jgi:hypothetical protein
MRDRKVVWVEFRLVSPMAMPPGRNTKAWFNWPLVAFTTCTDSTAGLKSRIEPVMLELMAYDWVMGMPIVLEMGVTPCTVPLTAMRIPAMTRETPVTCQPEGTAIEAMVSVRLVREVRSTVPSAGVMNVWFTPRGVVTLIDTLE